MVNLSNSQPGHDIGITPYNNKKEYEVQFQPTQY